MLLISVEMLVTVFGFFDQLECVLSVKFSISSEIVFSTTRNAFLCCPRRSHLNPSWYRCDPSAKLPLKTQSETFSNGTQDKIDRLIQNLSESEVDKLLLLHDSVLNNFPFGLF